MCNLISLYLNVYGTMTGKNNQEKKKKREEKVKGVICFTKY